MLFFPNYLSAMKTEVRCWWKLAKSTESISTNGRLSTSGSFQAISKSASSFFPKAFRNQSSGGEQREVNELLLLLLPFRETTSVSWRPSFRLRPVSSFFFLTGSAPIFSSLRAHARTCLQIQDDYLFAWMRSANFICLKNNRGVSRVLFINRERYENTDSEKVMIFLLYIFIRW